jgi:hypothetical protein
MQEDRIDMLAEQYRCIRLLIPTLEKGVSLDVGPTNYSKKQEAN